MKHLLITIALALVGVVAACSPAAAPTPGQVEAAPTLPPATSTPGQVESAPTMPAATVTIPPVQTKVVPTSPAAAPPSPSPGASPALTVTSAAFAEGGTIPKMYTCDGPARGISPPLKWTGAPAQTASFALILNDPDAPVGTFTHWVAFDIPSTETEIPEGSKNVGKAGLNSGGRTGFIGPCPPSGTHRYIFNIYALDVPSLNLNEGTSRDQVTNAIKGHVLAQGTLMGRYGR